MPEESSAQPQSGGQVYKLAKSELVLEDLIVKKFAGNDLIADHSLREIGQVTLESRSGFQAGCFTVGFVMLGIGLGCYFLHTGFHPPHACWTNVGLGALAGVGFIVLVGNLVARDWFLVVSTKTGVTEYPLKDDEATVAAFFQEMREHALKAGLMVDFRKGPKGATKPL